MDRGVRCAVPALAAQARNPVAPDPVSQHPIRSRQQEPWDKPILRKRRSSSLSRWTVHRPRPSSRSRPSGHAQRPGHSAPSDRDPDCRTKILPRQIGRWWCISRLNRPAHIRAWYRWRWSAPARHRPGDRRERQEGRFGRVKRSSSFVAGILPSLSVC